MLFFKSKKIIKIYNDRQDLKFYLYLLSKVMLDFLFSEFMLPVITGNNFLFFLFELRFSPIFEWILLQEKC